MVTACCLLVAAVAADIHFERCPLHTLCSHNEDSFQVMCYNVHSVVDDFDVYASDFADMIVAENPDLSILPNITKRHLINYRIVWKNITCLWISRTDG